MHTLMTDLKYSQVPDHHVMKGKLHLLTALDQEPSLPGSRPWCFILFSLLLLCHALLYCDWLSPS